MTNPSVIGVYWDASAILSAMLQDTYTKKARECIDRRGVHLISTLSYAEVYGVLAKIRRDGLMADVLVKAAAETLQAGPWHRLNISPLWDDVEQLSRRWRLRGAELWHLAAAKSIQSEIPELRLLTFDERLRLAALGEGLI